MEGSGLSLTSNEFTLHLRTFLLLLMSLKEKVSGPKVAEFSHNSLVFYHCMP